MNHSHTAHWKTAHTTQEDMPCTSMHSNRESRDLLGTPDTSESQKHSRRSHSGTADTEGVQEHWHRIPDRKRHRPSTTNSTPIPQDMYYKTCFPQQRCILTDKASRENRR
jgi:hypothetical protein